MSLTPQQLERYARHIMLKELGGPGQQKLLKGHVALVGLGALGGPAAMHLAASGVGRLTLIDDDAVALSNLQRQVLFRTADIGRRKVDAASSALKAINPDIAIVARGARLDEKTAAGFLAGADLIIDGTDSFATRFVVNQAAYDMGLTLVSGAVGRWSAQVATFKAGMTKRQPQALRLPCYRCLVPEAPESEETCAAVGVIGPLTGLIGARLALEAVKEIAGAGAGLAGRLWLFDGLSGEGRTIELAADPNCPVCGDASQRLGV